MDQCAAPPAVVPTWSLSAKLAFRFLCIYFVLYILPFPIGAVPYSEKLERPYQEFWQAVVPWVGQQVFGAEITVFPNGSGDTTYNYVQVWIFAVAATALTIFWSLIDSRRPNYERLHDWLRLYVRFYLAVTMISYGAVKVIPTQFPPPPLDRMIQPYGESSPMGLLWTFMGASKGYVIFTGTAEMLGGLLLTVRRTTLLGALISAGVMANVAVLNLCYDVPVKLFSLHLLAIALFLALPDLRRLADFFLFNRPAAPTPVRPLFGSRKWLNRGAVAVGTLFVGYLLYSMMWDANKDRAGGEKSVLYGIWRVEEFLVDGTPRPPLLTDKERWRRLVFDFPWLTTIQLMDGERVRWLVEIDQTKGVLKMRFPNQADRKTDLKYERPTPDGLLVTGAYEGKKIEVKLRREETGDFLLNSRGYRWINEYPFNR